MERWKARRRAASAIVMAGVATMALGAFAPGAHADEVTAVPVCATATGATCGVGVREHGHVNWWVERDGSIAMRIVGVDQARWRGVRLCLWDDDYHTGCEVADPVLVTPSWYRVVGARTVAVPDGYRIVDPDGAGDFVLLINPGFFVHRARHFHWRLRLVPVDGERDEAIGIGDVTVVTPTTVAPTPTTAVPTTSTSIYTINTANGPVYVTVWSTTVSSTGAVPATPFATATSAATAAAPATTTTVAPAAARPATQVLGTQLSRSPQPAVAPAVAPPATTVGAAAASNKPLAAPAGPSALARTGSAAAPVLFAGGALLLCSGVVLLVIGGRRETTDE